MFFKKQIIYFSIFIIIFITILIFLDSDWYHFNLEYWNQIYNSSFEEDYVKWYLSDKYNAKDFAQKNGFDIPKTYQLCENIKDIKIPVSKSKSKSNNNYVIKPRDLCNSHGVYIMKDGVNLMTNRKIGIKEIRKELVKCRAQVSKKFYLANNMYKDKRIYSSGYIVEELLLNKDGSLPCDYKFYVFNGKVKFIVKTFNRNVENEDQTFNSTWYTRSWIPIPFKMIKNGYKFTYHNKPNSLDKAIKLVEDVSRKMGRHCRIDVYIIEDKVYLGEFTFYGGAFLHTKICNLMLGICWKIIPDKKKNVVL